MGFFYDSNEHKRYSKAKELLKEKRAKGLISEQEYQKAKLAAKLVLWKSAKAQRGCSKEAKEAATIASQLFAMEMAETLKPLVNPSSNRDDFFAELENLINKYA